MRTKTIRVGYLSDGDAPNISRDPNTGKIFGIYVDALNNTAQILGLKVDYTEAVTWGTMIEGLNDGRYDVVPGIWLNTQRGAAADLSKPLLYFAVGGYVRPNDHRFDTNQNNINDKSIRIATIDGEQSDLIARSLFPNATRISLPQNADLSQLLLSVSQNKADVTFTDTSNAGVYLKSNPGTVRNLNVNKPLEVFPSTYMVRKGEEQFLSLLNTSVDETINTGQAELLIKKYETTPGSLYAPSFPYRSIDQ